jgi:hypothetical protein
MAIRMDHMVHDERFRAVMGVVMLLGLLITLAVLAATSENQSPIVTPWYP